MKLNNEGIMNKNDWQQKGYKVFEFDRNEISKETKANPKWIHFGAGNIFRAFQAQLSQTLLDNNLSDSGLIVIEGYDTEILEQVYKPYDNLSVLVTLCANGQIKKTIVGSVIESLCLANNHIDIARIKEIFCKDSLQMVSFTITEKGYKLKDANGNYFFDIQKDFEQGPYEPLSYVGKITSLLYARYKYHAYPIALVSMDNCSKNGTQLFDAIANMAKHWSDSNFTERGFYEYVIDEQKVSFPWTMIDKITPRPSEAVLQVLNEDHLENIEIIQTSKNSYVAPFVNAEESEYLVIEDNFPNGRPQLEKAGVYFCERFVVAQVEQMKVCTCLNPLHTTLAIFGCLLNYKTIYQAMKDTYLKELVEKIGFNEGMPVVTNPKIIDPIIFLKEVLEKRLINPFMPDTPQRIAVDTSMKLGVRFSETIKAYVNSKTLDVKDLELIPLVFAGWCRYLMGIDDEGKSFELSSDPALPWIHDCVNNIKLGEQVNVKKLLKQILSNQQIFQIDLYKLGINEKIEFYFEQMIKAKGAVKDTIMMALNRVNK